MIPDNLIIFIIMLILSWVFDHKILPQIAIVSMAFIEIYINVVGVSITASEVLYIFLFVINILYAVVMIYLGEPKDSDADEELS